MQALDPAPIIIGLIGSAGIGAFIKDIFDGIRKLISGVSATDQKRRIDVVQQRDEAIERAADEASRADAEAWNRRTLQEYITRERRKMLAQGIDPEPEPELYNTITRPQSRKLRDTKE